MFASTQIDTSFVEEMGNGSKISSCCLKQIAIHNIKNVLQAHKEYLRILIYTWLAYIQIIEPDHEIVYFNEISKEMFCKHNCGYANHFRVNVREPTENCRIQYNVTKN